MAKAPLPASSLTAPPGADPTEGGPTDTDAGDQSGDVLVTISSDGQGGYLVYAGDEPDSGGGADMSEDDADAMGAAGGSAVGGAAPPTAGAGGGERGVPADSIGAALKAALDILQAAASSAGAPGDAESQFAGGFSADKNPTPAGAGMKQKY